MATIEELVRQYETDEALQKEVDAILADNKITLSEFMGFVKKHDIEVTLADFPKLVEHAREAGLIK